MDGDGLEVAERYEVPSNLGKMRERSRCGIDGCTLLYLEPIPKRGRAPRDCMWLHALGASPRFGIASLSKPIRESGVVTPTPPDTYTPDTYTPDTCTPR